jgi:hypothetical protein
MEPTPRSERSEALPVRVPVVHRSPLVRTVPVINLARLANA